MIIDAIVLAGGRASRLGGASKAGLSLAGRTLLEHTLHSLPPTRQVVVVGDETDILAAAPDAAITIVREVPAFAGPAAAIAAGVDALGAASDFTVVVACDMPAVGGAIALLVAAVRDGSAGNGSAGDGSAGDGSDVDRSDVDRSAGAVAVSADGRAQPLVGIYSTLRLASCVSRHREAGDLENLSVRALLSGLDPVPVPVPEGSTDDVDTWADATRLGIATPLPPRQLVPQQLVPQQLLPQQLVPQQKD